jgi:hypothetical protein
MTLNRQRIAKFIVIGKEIEIWNPTDRRSPAFTCKKIALAPDIIKAAK